MNYKNDINPFAENEKILGLELGYKLKTVMLIIQELQMHMFIL